MTLGVWLAASYLLGAIPTSYWLARMVKGVDLRQVGSRNLGATNLYRTLGWRYAIPAGLFDLAKGAIPVLVFGPQAGSGSVVPLLCGLAAVIGHVFSLFVRFKGGKGVATATGVVLGLAPWATLICAVLWVVIVRLTGYVSLGSMFAAALLPPIAYVVDPSAREIEWFLAAIGLLVIVMHRANIRRLIAGTENRFGKRTPAGRPSP